MSEYPATRAAAKLINSQFYYTGKPCKYGHIAIRETRKGHCRTCRELEWQGAAENRAEYFDAYNKSEKGQANKKRYYADNREIVIAKAKARSAQVKQSYRKVWEAKNPENRKARVNSRRRRYKEATPKWQTAADIRKIKDFHLAAIEMTRLTGIKHEVDHIYPIQGEIVCGLHTPLNLQILTKEENLAKANKHIVN